MTLGFRVLSITICAVAAIVQTNIAARADETPKVNVLSVRRGFDNGEHNAFTDLCRFGDKYYLDLENRAPIQRPQTGRSRPALFGF